MQFLQGREGRIRANELFSEIVSRTAGDALVVIA